MGSNVWEWVFLSFIVNSARSTSSSAKATLATRPEPGSPGTSGTARDIWGRDSYELRVLQDQCAVEVAQIVEQCNRLGREVIFLGDGVLFIDMDSRRVAHTHLQRKCLYAHGLSPFQSLPQQRRSDPPVPVRLVHHHIINLTVPGHIGDAAAAHHPAVFLRHQIQAVAVLYQPDKIRCGPGHGKGLGLYYTERFHILRSNTLEVRVSNAAAIHVYEKAGFVSEGIRPRFYEKPTEDAMILWKRDD